MERSLGVKMGVLLAAHTQYTPYTECPPPGYNIQLSATPFREIILRGSYGLANLREGVTASMRDKKTHQKDTLPIVQTNYNRTFSINITFKIVT